VSHPAFEGVFASWNPRAVVLAGSVAYRAGNDGLSVARFGWANVDSGLVDNTRTSSKQIRGYVYPSVNGNSAVRVHRGQRIIRPGVGVTLYQSGDYWVRFSGGAVAGYPVYALLVDGTPISGEAAGAELTPWFVATDAAPGALAIISTTSKVTS
jgi:hypothetical protein